MKKLFAILLSVVLVASMCTVFAFAEGEEESAPVAPDYSTKPFWLTHYDEYKEAAGCVMTEADLGGTWGYHIAFAPVAGLDNVFEVVAIDDGSGETGSAGHAVALEVPEGGFVYVMELGNDYEDLYNSDPEAYGWVKGWPNYCNPGCNETTAMIKTWSIGDKFVFEGLDLEGKTVPTTTPDVLWYNDADDGDELEYVCTATVTPYVKYDETLSIDDKGTEEDTDDIHSYAVANGFTFPINGINGTIAGEDTYIIDNSDAYATCNPNWAVTVHLAPVDGLYEVVKVIESPGEGATLDLAEGEIALVVHANYSGPKCIDWTGAEITCPNYQAKIAALALKAGDKLLFAEDNSSAYVLMPGEVVETEGDDEPTLEEAILEAMGEKNEDSQFDVVIDAPESYVAGEEVVVTVTVKNIADNLGAVDFVLNYDVDKLVLTTEVNAKDNALLCVTKAPEAWDNLSNVTDDVIKVSLVSFYPEDAVTEDGDLVFTFTFDAKEDATGDIGVYIAHGTVTGAVNEEDSIPRVKGNGSYAIIADSAAEGDDGDVSGDVSDDESKGDDVKPGDASNMIVFAILALVAIAGSAVVIKSRK